MEYPLFTIYSTKELPVDFGFGVDPINETEKVKGIVEAYGILYYQDAARPEKCIFNKKYKGKAYRSTGIMKDFIIVKWQDIEMPPPAIERLMKKRGYDEAWFKLNEEVEIIEIGNFGVRLKR